VAEYEARTAALARAAKTKADTHCVWQGMEEGIPQEDDEDLAWAVLSVLRFVESDDNTPGLLPGGGGCDTLVEPALRQPRAGNPRKRKVWADVLASCTLLHTYARAASFLLHSVFLRKHVRCAGASEAAAGAGATWPA
jgi:hypothetical protein